MTRDCAKAHLWPDMKARVEGDEACTPPFREALAKASFAFLLVTNPNRAFSAWLRSCHEEKPEDARWQIVVAIDPSCGTEQTADVLQTLFTLQSAPESGVGVRLLTPGKLDARPRLNFAILEADSEGPSVSVGSSHAFGLGEPAAGDVTLWVKVGAGENNDVRELALAYWAIAAELTRARCEVPLLAPARGNEEGYINWRAYEALLNDAGDFLGEQGRNIKDLPLTESDICSCVQKQPHVRDRSPTIQVAQHDLGDRRGWIKMRCLIARHRWTPE